MEVPLRLIADEPIAPRVAARGQGVWRRLCERLLSRRDEREAAAATRQPATAVGDAARHWTPARLEVLQHLFGDNMVGPASERLLKQIFEPLRPPEGGRVVELGAALGGVGAWLARRHGVSVKAFDDRIPLVDAAARRLDRRLVDIDRRELDATDHPPGRAAAVIAKEGLTHIADKRALFRHALQLLRTDGQLLVTDFFLAGNDPECPEVSVWSALEERPVHLQTTVELATVLDEIGFEAPAITDLTDAYIDDIRKAFRRAGGALEQAAAAQPELRQALADEAAYWTDRVTLLKSGEVRLCRVATRRYQGGEVV